MSTRTTRARKTKESDTGPVDSRGGSGPSSATEKNDSSDQATTMAERVQQQSSVEPGENISLGSTSSTRPTSPVQATRTWELTAHGTVRCEKNAAGEAIHIILSTNPLNLQTLRPVADWTRSIYTALAESRPIMPFQQMYKPLSQEEVGYIRKRLEEYRKRHIHKLDGFDCAVILADAKTLFSYFVLLESTIKTHQTEPQSKKRPTGAANAAATTLGSRHEDLPLCSADGTPYWNSIENDGVRQMATMDDRQVTWFCVSHPFAVMPHVPFRAVPFTNARR
ncbi:predicted protein [Histoplasma mississippiense (nom. inval.)]|uniref:predicted protein n=1 Tax=Ajellomyces capsulatus (strain NAm1 / WU24) TaxID=2059318 RepID=UPI000157BABA|nr:predicted protein [Histoplasma mississippiense (nom. inval.)]EDN05789.1 predicted protein [Histoplasma mississippiense (nom. inval.)]